MEIAALALTFDTQHHPAGTKREEGGKWWETGERTVWPQLLLLVLLMLGAACAGTTRLSSQPWKHHATKRTKQQRFPFPAFSFPALVLSHSRVGTSCCHLASVPIPIPIPLPIRARRQ